MKKFAIGCLSIVGGFFVLAVIIGFITGLFEELGEEQKQFDTDTSRQEVELIPAQAEGLITLSANGQNSLSEIRLSLTSNSESSLEVVIPAGTIFESRQAGTSDIVVTQERVVSLASGEAVSPIDLNALSLDMTKSPPDEGDQLVPEDNPASGELAQLLALPGFEDESFRVRQINMVFHLIHSLTYLDSTPLDRHSFISLYDVFKIETPSTSG